MALVKAFSFSLVDSTCILIGKMLSFIHIIAFAKAICSVCFLLLLPSHAFPSLVPLLSVRVLENCMST